MSPNAEREAARRTVGAYHEAELADLVQRLGEAIDGFRAGEIDAFEVDQVAFQFTRAAQELWKFCNASDVEFAARVVSERPPNDWWERGAPRRR